MCTLAHKLKYALGISISKTHKFYVRLLYMALLPPEIIHRILEYDGRIKYRNGKYMDQIPRDDYRYALLETIPKLFPNYLHQFCYILVRNRKLFWEKLKTPYEGTLGEETFLVKNYERPHSNKYVINHQGFRYILTIYKPRPTFTGSVSQFFFGVFNST